MNTIQHVSTASIDTFIIFAARCYTSAAYVVMRRCLCVYLSVTFVNYVKTNKHSIKVFSPSGSHTILVFSYQTA